MRRGGGGKMKRDKEGRRGREGEEAKSESNCLDESMDQRVLRSMYDTREGTRLVLLLLLPYQHKLSLLPPGPFPQGLRPY